MASPLRIRLRQQNSPTRQGANPTKTRPRRLRPPERSLAEALDQLRAGVPLNWSQLEDDPELATLASLQAAAAEGREVGRQVPTGLRSMLLEQLAKGLPNPKPETAKVKEAPKSPSGFTGKVYVPAQTEEDVPRLTATALPWIVGGIVALALIIWGISAFSGPKHTNMTFSWVEARQAGKTISKVSRPADWEPLQCVFTGASDSASGRTFLTLTDPGQIEASAGTVVSLLPNKLSSPISYTLGFGGGGVAPCADTVPDPADLGTIVKLSYVASSRPNGSDYIITPFTVFQFRSQPSPLDVGSGTWEEVRTGDWHGIYWRGGSYNDMAGTDWKGDVSVLAVERGDFVMNVVGQNDQGINKGLLLALLDEMEKTLKSSSQNSSNTNNTSSNTPEGAIPPFRWIEVVKGGETLAERQLPAARQTIECATYTASPRSFRRNFVRFGPLDVAESYVGYRVLSLPGEDTGVLTYTVRSAQAAVGPCTPGTPTPKDPLATIKLSYAVNVVSEQGLKEVRFTLFESQSRPITFDVGTGQWEVLHNMGVPMLYWTGNPYRDPEGIEWNMGTNVLVVERGDYALILMGFAASGASKETLVQMAQLLE